jgi:hypothetical protein
MIANEAASTATNFIADMFAASTDHSIYLSSLANRDAPEDEPTERHVATRDVANIEAFVRKWDRKHRGLYFCVSTLVPGATRRCKDNLSELTGLHVDVDFKDVKDPPDEVAQALREVLLPPSKIVSSGNGLHAYWHFRESLPATPENIARVEHLLRRLCDHLGGDPAVCEAARLMRLPGTHNTKDGAWKAVEITDYRPAARYDIGELEEWLADATPIIRRKPAAPGNGANRANGSSGDNPFLDFGEQTKAPIDIEERLAAMRHQGVGETSIHTTQLQVSASLLSQGRPIDEIVDILLAATRQAAGEAGATWNWDREARAIRDMCLAWLKKHPEIEQNGGAADTVEESAQGVPDEDLGLLCDWEDTDTEPPVSWLVKHVFETTGVGLVSGQWGTYKTFAVLDLAGAVMAGKPFIRFPVKRQGGVLFLAAEGGSQIRVRLAALRSVISPGARLPFIWKTECPRLLEKGALAKLETLAKAAHAKLMAQFNLPLALIVIDTVVVAAGYTKSGDDNDAATAQAVMGVCSKLSTRTNCFVLAVDHFGKNVDTGTRGSSAKEGHADTILALLGDRNIEGKMTNTRLAIRKRRGGDNGEEIAFSTRVVTLGIDEDDEPETSLVIEWGMQEPAPAADKKGGWPKSLRVFHRAVLAMLDACGTEIRPWPDSSLVRAVSLELVRTEFYKTWPADGDTEAKRQRARRQRFHKATQGAQQRSLLMVREVEGVTFLWLADPKP